MSKKLLSLIALCFFSATAFGANLPSFFSKDAAEAQNDILLKNPIMLVFSTSWCGPCKRMVRDVWNNTSQFKPAYEAYEFTPYYIDADLPENASLVRQFGVSSIPTVYYITQDGKKVLQGDKKLSSVVSSIKTVFEKR
jgi:thiol-disulfide isomerase/thioredoxin